MKNIIITAVLFLVCYQAKSQIGIGTPLPDQSSVLDLESTSQGFLPPRLTTEERDAIASPAEGLVIFNTSKNCMEWKLATGWYNACGDNGLGIVTTYTCNTGMTGGMTAGVPVSGVSQTITADVAVTGSYDISATSNGVTFSGSGNFTSTGLHDIVLTANGIPTAAGDHSFTLNTSPNNCSFTRTTGFGAAVVTGYICTTASTGTMMVGTAVTGVTQTITATVATAGNYNIRAAVNGVTFEALGTFTTTGPQNVLLRATGTPTVAGAINFAIEGTPTCAFTRNIDPPVPRVTGPDGRVWMAYNLGATRVATSATDAASYGDLYQWGRSADGHQRRNSGITGAKSGSDNPGHGLFITTQMGIADNWRNPFNGNLWGGSALVNNPCPTGFRPPTDAEWNNVVARGNITNAATAFTSALRLPAAGQRQRNGTLSEVGTNGNYWSGTITRTFRATATHRFSNGTAIGASVRCIQR